MQYVSTVLFSSSQRCCVHHQEPEGQRDKLTQTTVGTSGRDSVRLLQISCKSTLLLHKLQRSVRVLLLWRGRQEQHWPGKSQESNVLFKLDNHCVPLAKQRHRAHRLHFRGSESVALKYRNPIRRDHWKSFWLQRTPKPIIIFSSCTFS